MEQNKLFAEAEKIGYYLLKINIQNSEKQTYSNAIEMLDFRLSDVENKLWTFMLESNWKMACIDAGLAIIEPASNIRRKLFTMLAILEASPNYTKYFLSENFSTFYIFKIIIVGLRSVFRAIFGIILIKIENS